MTAAEERHLACIASLAELERHARAHRTLEEAYAPWCAFCAAAAELLNADRDEARPAAAEGR